MYSEWWNWSYCNSLNSITTGNVTIGNDVVCDVSKTEDKRIRVSWFVTYLGLRLNQCDCHSKHVDS